MKARIIDNGKRTPTPRTYEDALADAVKAPDREAALIGLRELRTRLARRRPDDDPEALTRFAVQEVLTAAEWKKEPARSHAISTWDPLLELGHGLLSSSAEPAEPASSSEGPSSFRAEATAIAKVAEALDELPTREEQCRAMAMVATALGYYDHAQAFLAGAARARGDQ